VLLRLNATTPSGIFNQVFTGSQLSHGINYVTGAYFANVNVSSANSLIKSSLGSTGSYVDLTPIWTTLDQSVTFHTGSKLRFSRPTRSSSRSKRHFVVTIENMKTSYPKDHEETLRLNVFDQTSPLVKVVKVPVEMPGIVLPKVYYSVRDAITNSVAIPFDTEMNSTRMSSDATGMFFTLDTSSLIVGRTYTIDIMISADGDDKVYKDVSPVFLVDKN
jgi:hypothetical protein